MDWLDFDTLVSASSGEITPRDLQGFPIDYKLPDVCNSALYKLAGNAVSLPVINLVVNKLEEIIKILILIINFYLKMKPIYETN